jgi:protocatechuate 3,4-dioxygenase beta subunit
MTKLATAGPNKLMKSKTSRRHFIAQIGAAGLASAFTTVPGAFAQALIVTPEQTEGPYYPITLPLDTDNDLLVINSNITPAVGTVAYLSGRILDSSGTAIRNAHVEIWHADNTGAYIHPSSMGYASRDQNFQGFGRFLTGSTGEYLFRTIVPGLYTGRTRHIHMKVEVSGRPDLTTQVYFQGEPQDAADGILKGIPNAEARNSVIVPFTAVEGSEVNAVAGIFNVVLGFTAASVASLTITNTTDPARNTSFNAGDGWGLNLSGALVGSRVYLHIWRNAADLGVSGPYGSDTDENGFWSLTGSFGAQDAGVWQMMAVIGSAGSGVTSSRIGFTVG